MANPKTLALLALVLALIFGAMFFAAREGGERSAAERQETAAVTPGPERPVEVLAAAGLARAADAPAERSSERAAVAAVAEPQAAAPKSEEGPAAAVRFVGRVQDSRGRPVPDADVQHQPDFTPLALTGSEFPRAQTTKSDAEGRFELGSAALSGGRLTVAADGFAPFERVTPALVAGTREELEPVVLALGATVSGRVMDRAGRPVPKVQIDLAPAEGEFSRFRMGMITGDAQPLATTADDGSFAVRRLPLGPFRLRFESPWHPTRTVEGNTDEFNPDLAGITVELIDGVSIDGFVEGLPSGAADVEVTAHKAGGRFAGFPGAEGQRATAVAADGTFRIDGLDPETEYRLRVALVAKAPENLAAFVRVAQQRTSSPAVTAMSGATGVRIEWRASASLTFRAVDSSTAEAIERFEARFADGARMPFAMPVEAQARTHRPAGRATLTGLNAAQRRPGTLVVEADGYEPFEQTGVRLEPGADVNLGDILLVAAPSLEVTVLDRKSGAPVADATVTLTAAGVGAEPEAGRAGRRFGVRVTSRGGGVSVENGVSRTAVTNERGVAIVAAPPGERGELRVESDDHAPFALADVALPAEGRRPQEVRLGAGGLVVVTVVDSDGVPQPARTVGHRPPDESTDISAIFTRPPMTTDAEGVVRFERLAVGTHRFRPEKITTARAGGFVFNADISSADDSWTDVEVAEGMTHEVRLLLTPQGLLEGRVREGGKALAGANVALVERSDGPAGGMRGFAAFGDGNGVQTDGDGRYRIADVEPGSYTLTVSHPRRALPDELAIEIEPRTQRKDVELSITVVEGRVTGADGKPAAGLRVGAQRVAPERAGRAMRAMMMTVTTDGEDGSVVQIDEGGATDATRTDDEGRYRLVGLPADTEVRVVVTGTHIAEARSQTLKLLPDEVRTGIDLKVQPAGAIRVRLVRADGTPAGMTVVQAEPAPDQAMEDSVRIAPAFAGADGRATLRSLPAGRWRVYTQGQGFGPPSAGGAQKMVDVVGGETVEVEIEVPG